MHVMTYTEARNSMNTAMDRAINDDEVVVVTRKNREAVVMISLDEYNAITETLHLLQSPRNARRLRRSVDQLTAGEGTEREIAENENDV